MAVAFVAVTTAGDSDSTSLVISRASTTTDHLNALDVYLESGSDATLNFNNGTWVQVTSRLQVGSTPDFYHHRYREKYAGAGASVTVTWPSSGSFWRSGVMNAYSGVDTTTAMDVAATSAASATSSTSAVAPGLTTATNGAMVVYGEADFDGRTVTSPTGTTPTFTERTDFANLQVADGILATAGATGDKTGTLATASWNASGLLALRPSGGAPATIPPGLGPVVGMPMFMQGRPQGW